LTTDEMIRELYGLTTVFNYKPIWDGMIESGVTGGLVSAGMIMIFGVTCIGMLTNMRALVTNEGKRKGVLEVNMRLFVKAIVMGFTVLFYIPLCDIFLSIFGAFNDLFFSRSIQTFRGDFHYLIASISGQSDAQTPLFFPSLKASIEVFLFSASINFLVILFYIVILFCPAFMVIALASGPVLIPLGLYSTDILLKWGLFILAAGFLPAFVGLGIQIINTMDYLPAMALSGIEGKLIQTIFLATGVAVYTSAIPATVAHLFGARPIAAFSVVSGFLSLCTCMFSTSLNTIAQVFFFRNRKR
jgi:hypothetical protein